jgi:membrane-bound ClpP family serine protease
VIAVVLAAALLPVRAEQPIQDGLFISVPNPITENAVLQIDKRVQLAAVNEGRSLRTVVFDFNPGGKPAGTTNVFTCMQLKSFISRLRSGAVPQCPNVLTVAYIHEEVTDHTVLPVLACRKIVMSSKGKLGHVLRNQDKELANEGKQAYDDVVKLWPVAGLLPRLMEPSKTASMFDLDEARKVGLCEAPRAESRTDVMELFSLPPLSLREDALIDRTPVVWRIEIHGELNPGKLNSLERRLKAAIRQQANIIVLHLDCEGGETRDASAMAEKLRTLTDFGGGLPVKTIAYVPPGRSLGAATFLALGCSEIAMAPDAKLGGFAYLANLDPQELAVKRKMLVDLARLQGYPSAPFQAMLEPAKGEFFSLDAAEAKKLGIARYSDITSPETLYDRYGLGSTKVEVSRDDWLDAVAAFLRAPAVNVLLIMVGIAGLILELKIPGFGVPGILSAICFVLFFWSHAFAGQSSMEFILLAILLFVLGIILVGVEIFVLPGFGITGISGAALIVISLALVILEQMPSTSEEWGNVGGALATVGFGLVAGMTAAITLARYLPNIPYANRLVLEPPDEQEQTTEAHVTQMGFPAASLLGAIGVAATTLRPAGKVQFGENFLDVVAEGDFVDAGARVQVIEIEGNRIVVKEVS